MIRLHELPADHVNRCDLPHLFTDCRVELEPGAKGPYMDLSITWDDFCRSHESFRKRLKRLGKLPDGFDIRIFADSASVVEGLDQYVQIEQKSWKKGQVGVSKDDQHLAFYRDVLPALAANDQVAIRTLSSGDRLIAGDITYTFDKSAFFQHATYDDAFKKLSPGSVFTGLVIKEYLERGYEIGDFLCGFADYLSPWCDGMIETTGVTIYRRSSRRSVVDWLRSIRNRIPSQVSR